TNWGRNIAGDPGLGRDFPTLDIELWQESSPLVTVDDSGKWLWFDITDNQKAYIVLLVICLFMVWMAKNIVRTRTGRALQAIRDRDVAAEIMGVSEFKYKLIAFGISSFYAGVAGALFASLVGKLPAVQWNLFLSVEFVAIILIGGIGTVSGTILGTAFVLLGPQLIEEVTEWLADQSEAGGLMGGAAEVVLTRGPGDFGPVSVATQTPGWPLNVFDWNIALYGILIVVFLIFEPLGLYGIWARARNYWKRWPFSY
ncbi:MAG: branched-chain amino acid ABC transporter permease, partial [Actinomycetota bacterium]|nr:branched-chain amino acid ABC transporter permease [Actinomycetota bacterium]